MTIHIDSVKTIWQKAAEFILESLLTHQNEKILLLLSGGSAVKLYDRIKSRLSGIPHKAGNYELRITDMAIGQVDERFRPNFQFSIFNFQSISKNQNINATQIGKSGLWEACEKNKIPYYLVSQEGTLGEAAEKYDQTISKLFKEYNYKIAVLGIGEDCHTAGLLPGYEKIWNKESHVAGYHVNSPQIIRQRITVTPKVLQQLDHAIVVATGEKKRGAIKKALDPVNQSDLNKYPAAILQKIKKVDLFTDIDLV